MNNITSLKPNFNDLHGLQPSCKCKKCGGKQWFSTEEPLCWSCIYCGNIVYLTYGSFKQQIDIIKASKKGSEFVESEDREKIVPKKNERVKEIKFNAQMGKRSKND